MKKYKVNKRVTKRRHQKGGGLFNPFTWFEGNDWGGWFSNVGTKAKETTSQILNSTNKALGTAATNITSGAENMFKSAGNVLSTDIPLTDNTNSSTQLPVETNVEPVVETNVKPVIETNVEPVVETNVKPVVETNVDPELSKQNLSIGGRKKRKKYTLKGGKGLGLTYYATPVSNMKVASPTYWEVYNKGTNQYNIKGGSKKRISKKRRNKYNKTKKH